MTPVYQTIHGPQGNCYAACVASILETSLEDLPPYVAVRRPNWEPPGYSIASVRVRDGSIHAVVCLDGQIVHDPAGRPFARPEDPVVLWTVLQENRHDPSLR